MSLDRMLHRTDVINPDAEMVQPDEVPAALVAGVFLGLELEQRDIHHPV